MKRPLAGLTRTVSVRVPVEVYDAMAAYANSHDRTVSWIINTIVSNSVSDLDKALQKPETGQP